MGAKVAKGGYKRMSVADYGGSVGVAMQALRRRRGEYASSGCDSIGWGEGGLPTICPHCGKHSAQLHAT
jgi:hypothetical protein